VCELEIGSVLGGVMVVLLYEENQIFIYSYIYIYIYIIYIYICVCVCVCVYVFVHMRTWTYMRHLLNSSIMAIIRQLVGRSYLVLLFWSILHTHTPHYIMQLVLHFVVVSPAPPVYPRIIMLLVSRFFRESFLSDMSQMWPITKINKTLYISYI